MALKLLRTIRLDPSDGFVFEPAAEPGEWAVVGSFLFWGTEPDRLEGKMRAAFRSGFLGIESFGWSTLAIVTEIEPAAREEAVDQLALRLVERLGAPDLGAARAAAAEEIAFAASLCDPPPQTLIALTRRFEAGAIREQFRTLRPKGPLVHDKAFGFWAEPSGAADEQAGEVDLLALARGRP
jgi:Family of unknown function (DUF6505)